MKNFRVRINGLVNKSRKIYMILDVDAETIEGAADGAYFDAASNATDDNWFDAETHDEVDLDTDEEVTIELEQEVIVFVEQPVKVASKYIIHFNTGELEHE